MILHFKGLKDMPGQEVNVFAAWQHSHLLAYAMSTYHLRNGQEIEPFADDQAYDFNYQQIRLFPKEVPLKMVRKVDSRRNKHKNYKLTATFNT